MEDEDKNSVKGTSCKLAQADSNTLKITDTEQGNLIFSSVSEIIESRKFNAISIANSQIVLMFWEIGKYINFAILGMERAEYDKSFEDKNLRRMMQFASHFRRKP